MRKIELALDTTVDQVMNCWPVTIRIFMDFRMGCVGCPIAAFHSVADACREHHVDESSFLAALRAAAAENAPGQAAAIPQTTAPRK
jgi:hybrid cluster-associated redox disulfide protein